MTIKEVSTPYLRIYNNGNGFSLGSGKASWRRRPENPHERFVESP